jgi:uncharacterized protein YndB with AHSA1/START domain
MTTLTEDAPAEAASRDLTLERRLDAPRAALWRCWTEAPLIERWFTPAPWTTHDVRIEPRAGGVFASTMRGPAGEVHSNAGVILEAVPGERIVFTDAFRPGWEPAEKPFFTAIVTFADAPGGGTLYRAVARHWRDEDRATHEAMGFHDGWGKAADQLETLARGL